MRILPAIVFCLLFSTGFSQPVFKKPGKYPSLMWEITGNGLDKPSYLFGTMHVSSKLAFHLSDSFYFAVQQADVVGLETDPGNWQEDFSRYDMEPYMPYMNGNLNSRASDYLTIGSLRAQPYEKLIIRGLYGNPSIVNNFLYRNSSEISSEFEEDTYLDLYIYQVGKKLKKQVCGLEDFHESVRLMKEAFADALKDRKSLERSYDMDEQFSYARMEEAYRTGNLDLLDTIQKLNSRSASFDEKFLYHRNDIQAASIDSILRTGASLFAGVGAAHLPGDRGVIEILRRQGYKLRPVKMTERDSRFKEEIEKIYVPVPSAGFNSPDGFFSVSLPGKLYDFSGMSADVAQQQYADMINGSYYMVTRIQTHAAFWGHSTADVARKVDSVLYENIPGKILSKEVITLDGYRGFDITNRTRRGDFQRYNIFITPFEVIIFKVSGNGDYVKESVEAERFFSSIRLKHYKTEWKIYSPASGGFEAEMPHQPLISRKNNWHYLAYDEQTRTAFQIIRTDIFNTDFVEEDGFDLDLMEESFASSRFIQKQMSSRKGMHQGYPCMDVKYRYRDGSVGLVRFLIQGPHYYTLTAVARHENPSMKQFLNSFKILPFAYPEEKEVRDTLIGFTVMSPVPLEKQTKEEIYPAELFIYARSESDDPDDELEDDGFFRDRIVRCDSTGELIHIHIYRPSRYDYRKESKTVGDTLTYRSSEFTWTFRHRKNYKREDGFEVFEYEMGSPGSSRMLLGKNFYRNGVSYSLETLSDTLSRPSSFVSSFFSSFSPVDTLEAVSIHEKKSDIFFGELFSTDTLLRKKALRNIDRMTFDSTDFPMLKKAVASLTWKEKKYFPLKKQLILTFAEVQSSESSDYLKSLYYEAGDTLAFQYAVLATLLDQQTSYAYSVFRDIMLNDPPVLNIGGDYYRNDNDFLEKLQDTLHLTRLIFPDLLSLLHIDDYEADIMDVLTALVDSCMAGPGDYDEFVSKFLLEAKQLLKKQVIREMNKSISEAQHSEMNDVDVYPAPDRGTGNYRLSRYATLLLPFWDRNPAVPQFMNQLLASRDNRLRYNTALLLIRNNRPVHDSILLHFAARDEFRYELYDDLADMDKQHLFPKKYNNHIDLARSFLCNMRSYNAPDSFAYLDRIQVKHGEREGYVYFFKYRQKKDDLHWKIATAGLVPLKKDQYQFPRDNNQEYNYSFNRLTDEKLKQDEPVKEQLKKILKRALYAKRKSAVQFYRDLNESELVDVFSPFED